MTGAATKRDTEPEVFSRLATVESEVQSLDRRMSQGFDSLEDGFRSLQRSVGELSKSIGERGQVSWPLVVSTLVGVCSVGLASITLVVTLGVLVLVPIHDNQSRMDEHGTLGLRVAIEKAEAKFDERIQREMREQDTILQSELRREDDVILEKLKTLAAQVNRNQQDFDSLDVDRFRMSDQDRINEPRIQDHEERLRKLEGAP